MSVSLPRDNAEDYGEIFADLLQLPEMLKHLRIQSTGAITASRG